jgi:hypothetical protein
MYKHLDRENLLSRSQHGFRSKCSTTSALLHSNFKYVSYLDNRADVDEILFDFSKAFDVVNHRLLLLKVKAYGFGKFTCSWITDFLTGRQQYVGIGPAVSRLVSVHSGVIQGSVLGPLLFLIYVNDLPDVVRSSDAFLYADDLKICKAITSNDDRLNVQADIDAVSLWANRWLLPLNLGKLLYVHFGSRFERYTYLCNSSQISCQSEVNDLGVLISERCNYRGHYNAICRKAYALIAQIFRSFESRDCAFLMSMFNLYIRPIIEYASPVWSPHLKMDVNQIERIQRAYTKRIPVLSNLSYAERLLAINTVSLEHRRLYLDLVLLYKIVHGLSSLTMRDIGLCPVHVCKLRVHGYNINSSFTPASSLSLYCFSYRTCKLWNALPKSLFSLSLNGFKRKMLKLDLPALARGTMSP